MASDSNWYCVDCGTVIGKLEGGELRGVEENPSTNYTTRGPNLKVTCHSCGRVKIWFTSDTITRALYQLIEAISGEAAKKMLHKVNKEQNY